MKKVIVGLLTAVLAVPASLSGFATPAFAYDPNSPSVIDLEQVPTKTPVASDPGDSSSGSDCNQPFPAYPVVECGYIGFGDTITLSSFGGTYARSESGSRPVSTFEGFSIGDFDAQVARAKGSAKYAKDPASPDSVSTIPPSLTTNIRNAAGLGVTTTYWSRGAYWKDSRRWSQITNSKGRWLTVTVTETCVQKTRVLVPAKPAVKDKKGKIIVPAKPAVTEKYQECTTDPKTVTTETVKYGKEWGYRVDTTTKTYATKGTYRYYQSDVNITALWTGRDVDVTGIAHYPTPTVKQLWCQTELGPGMLKGPYNHNGKPLNSQIGIKKTDLDPQTIERQWWTKPENSQASMTKKAPGGFILMSPIGKEVENRPSTFRVGNSTAENLVLDCIDKKPRYLASADNQPCIVKEPSHPLFGKELPATHELCNTFVPGNYLKDLSNSEEILCTYVERNWVAEANSAHPSGRIWTVGRSPSSAERVTFIHCGEPTQAKNNPDRPNSPNAIDYPITKAFWACQGDTPASGNKTWHPDQSYDFLTCGQKFICEVGNTKPTIIDVQSNTRTTSSSQLLASGAQAQIVWELPKGIQVLDRNNRVVGRIQPDRKNAWQSWNVLDNSAPWISNLAPTHSSQPVFGSNIKNSSPNNSSSILNYGVNNWDNPTLYIRGYRGTTVAKDRISVGKDLIVQPGKLVPFGVYTEFNTTIEKNTVVFGRPVKMNQPVSCQMDPAYLYYISGRATG